MSVVAGLGAAAGFLALTGGRTRRPPAAPVARTRARTPVAPVPELSSVLALVSAQLRSGAAPTTAWSWALGRPTGPIPTVAQLGEASGGRRRSARGRRAAAVVAAARLSDDLGAPLADVLDRVAAGLAADEEAEGERTAALAGPRATAQVLAWLPVVGLALGALVGARPVDVVLDGGVGTASAVLGVALVLLGRWWTSALVRRAS